MSRFHHYHRGENGSPVSGAWRFYLRERTAAKGWYSLFPRRRGVGDSAELEVALGGEDNMLQAGVRLPLVGCCYVGVRVPRWTTRGWVYQRREWTIRIGYIGHWLDVLIAYDDSARDMASYYRAKRARGEDVEWSRLATWPGVSLSLRPRLKDRLLGREICTTTTGDPVAVLVPMPEGNYPGTAKREERVWKRKRWPWSERRRVEFWIDMQIGVPTPGKGENSWDCDDDGIYGTGGGSVPEAIANVVRAAMRNRERYGSGAAWVPSRGWPEGIDRRVA